MSGTFSERGACLKELVSARPRGDSESTIEAATPVNWQLLARMELHGNARRQRSGEVTLSRWAPPGIFLYGPHLRLVTGQYRLSFHCEASHTRSPSQPVLGVEVIAQNKVSCGWRDFTADELNGGATVIDFEVPSNIGAETGVDGPFEFRFSHLLNADMTVKAIDLRRLAPNEADMLGPAERRLVGRVRPPWQRLLAGWRSLWLELRRPNSIRISQMTFGGLLPWRCEPRLRLPGGLYRLKVQCSINARRRPSKPALRIEIVTQDRIRIAAHDFLIEELTGEHAGFDFEVPSECAIESGDDVWFEFKIIPLLTGSFTIQSFNLQTLLLTPSALSLATSRRPAAIQKERAKLVIVGNCQAGLVAEAFRQDAFLARRFKPRHHYMELPANLCEQGEKDLAECDILLVQDIRDWEKYPLRDRVPSGLPIVKFPCLGFASLWPFDAFNGPDDKEARRRDFPNYEFTYFDGLLGRLRREIPDPESRFAAYRSLDIDHLIDYRRIHAFEERRLAAMDTKFGGSIGSFVLENFRSRRVFHTTGHPNGEVLAMLLGQIATSLGVKRRGSRLAPLEELERLQIPVHPKVARMLGVTWADERTRYAYRGEQITWEQYIRNYIAYYG